MKSRAPHSPKPRHRGFLLSFEGGDGAGKSTQIRLLKSWLRSHQVPLTVTLQPGGSPLGKRLRTLVLSKKSPPIGPRAELFLYLADRAQHAEQVVLPELKQGKFVISDRFGDSSVVYQGVCRKLGLEWVEELNQFALEGLEPDLTVFLDIPAREGLSRVHGRRAPDRLESEKLSFHETVRKGYRKIARRHPKRFLIVDARKPAEALFSEIASAITQRVKQRSWKLSAP